jgi:HK97 family phage major capsid protein
VFNLDTEPKATQNLLDDAATNVESWLADKVGSKFGRFENKEFVTGAANKIRGFVLGYPVALDDGSGSVPWGTIGYVATGVAGDFAAAAKGDKLYDLMGALKNDYLINAAWFTRRSVITAIRKFKDGQNNYLWQPSFIAGQPETIMGYPVVRMEDFPAIAADSLSLAFGDLKQAYQIIDRQGIRVLRDPYTSKPFIKFYTTKRTGGGVVNFEAIKLMKFGTT